MLPFSVVRDWQKPSERMSPELMIPSSAGVSVSAKAFRKPSAEA